jgi:hypothetical protein
MDVKSEGDPLAFEAKSEVKTEAKSESSGPSGKSIQNSTGSTSTSITTTNSSSATTNNGKSMLNMASSSASSNAGSSNAGDEPELADVTPKKSVTPSLALSEVKTEPAKKPPPRTEPHVDPVNGIVQPAVVPPSSRPGRITNQLLYLKNNVIKGMAKLKLTFL